MTAGRIGATAASLGSSGLATLAGMPWGIAAVVSSGAMLVMFAGAILPQESGDRLQWWQSFWARKRPSVDEHGVP